MLQAHRRVNLGERSSNQSRQQATLTHATYREKEKERERKREGGGQGVESKTWKEREKGEKVRESGSERQMLRQRERD